MNNADSAGTLICQLRLGLLVALPARIGAARGLAWLFGYFLVHLLFI
jgi:hypothetical protein